MAKLRRLSGFYSKIIVYRVLIWFILVLVLKSKPSYFHNSLKNTYVILRDATLKKLSESHSNRYDNNYLCNWSHFQQNQYYRHTCRNHQYSCMWRIDDMDYYYIHLYLNQIKTHDCMLFISIKIYFIYLLWTEYFILAFSQFGSAIFTCCIIRYFKSHGKPAEKL